MKFLEHNKVFETLREELESIYFEYRNKDRIILLLNYWLYIIYLTNITYGHKGLEEFLKSKETNPLRFSFSYEFNIPNENKLKKVSSGIFSLLLFRTLRSIVLFNKVLYLGGGYPTKKLTEKIYNVLSNKLVDNLPQNINVKTQSKINDLVRKYTKKLNIECDKDLLFNNIPSIFFSNQYNFNLKETLHVKGSATAFFEFSGSENILLFDLDLFISGYQHGGGYFMYKDPEDSLFESFEMKMCNKFNSWGLSELTYHQSRFKKLDDSNNNKNERNIYWLEGGGQPSVYKFLTPFNYSITHNIANKLYIHEELLETKHLIKNITHPLRPDPVYEKIRFDIADTARAENIIKVSDVVIFDQCDSTMLHFCIENNIPYLVVIDRSDLAMFSDAMNEWIDCLYSAERLFFNDEKGKLHSQIININNNETNFYNERLANFHKKFF